MYVSVVEQRGSVAFPQYTGERVYMEPFTKKQGLPTSLCRWQGTVDSMLAGIETELPMYIMIDQSIVRAGSAQRRPGLHIDGYWRAELGRHSGGHRIGSASDSNRFLEKEAILLASSVSASRAFVGPYGGNIGDGGECSDLDVSGLREVRMQANSVYAGNVCFLHESLPVESDCMRTLVRINVPGWSPSLAA